MTAKFPKALLVASAVAATFAATPTNAAAAYIGADDNVNSLALMIDAQAAAAAFDAATPGSTIIGFEEALPAGVSISGGFVTNDNGICAARCGFNTTVAGAYFYQRDGFTTTFSFDSPIDYFGLYITGVQSNSVGPQSLTFWDGSEHTIAFPSAVDGDLGSGGIFIGFTDFGKSITNLSIYVDYDVVSFDDIRFGYLGAVPEPANWAMMIGGLGMVGAVMRRRKTSIAFA